MAMAGSVSRFYNRGSSSDGSFNVPDGEAMEEWRSCDQVDNGTPSTCPPFWDPDDETDGGVKPSELYGRHTWKIEKFSQIGKKELKSSVFEVNNYKWYILIYPQGCDVCNHLSLFLCVADHENLFPGWGHFAQFTIAVVNKDPKKSKYSDTLHRFWKKEHDWGWKKFMELNKVKEGFVDEDTLEIRAQVQIIREQLHRPFRCLDRQYRRELLRVYISNVEQVCLRFLEEQKAKLLKLIQDKVGWTSFCTFWLKTDLDSKQCMSKEKTDAVFRVIVKHFFVEKEVTSTLVMDSLYCGLKALEIESKCRKGKGNLSDSGDDFSSLVYVDDNMFILADDILCLLQKASLESLLPKDEKCLTNRSKGPQDRKKDGMSGEDLNKDFERDERRLMELGRRTIEIFVLAHIFSLKIEAAFKEEVALKRQNELIREEEAANKAEIEQRARRQAAEREKRLRRKMRRNNRKCKGRGKDDQSGMEVTCDSEQYNPAGWTIGQNSGMLADSLHGKPNKTGDVSDMSDEGEADGSSLVCVDGDSDSPGACSPRSELSLENDDERKSLSFTDENSSCGSAESSQSEEQNVLSKREPNGRSRIPPTREKKERSNVTSEPMKKSVNIQQSNVQIDTGPLYRDSKCSTSTTQGLKAWSCKRDYGKWVEKYPTKKKELPMRIHVDVGTEAKRMMETEASYDRDYPSNSISHIKLLQDGSVREESSANLHQAKIEVLPMKQLSQNSGNSKKHIEKAVTSKPVSKLTENRVLNQVRDPKSNGPLLSSKLSAISGVYRAPPTLPPNLEKQLDSEQPSTIPRSCENSVSATCVMGLPISRSSSRETANASPVQSASSPFVHLLDNSVNDLLSGVTFGSVTQEVLRNGNQFPEASLQSQSASSRSTENLNSHDSRRVNSTDTVSATLFHQPVRASLDEFPHLDIINSLFDEDLEISSTAGDGNEIPRSLGEYSLVHQVSSPNDLGMFELSSVSYSAEAQQVYGPSGSHMNGIADVLSVYGNGHLDGMVPMGYGSTVGLLGEGHPYHVPDYSNLACGISGYPVFQLSNGH